MKRKESLLDKKKVLKSIKEMPDKFSADDVLDRIMILEKMERAIADSEAGRTISLEEMKKEVKKWRK